ncbi:hypothetical protein [Sorangium sp. So ce381]|uniref:hypothetical protein n=1 Tax=Sorangium sp. So ce381 TaxID=3133307 RepID=UPI003F5C5BDE
MAAAARAIGDDALAHALLAGDITTSPAPRPRLTAMWPALLTRSMNRRTGKPMRSQINAKRDLHSEVPVANPWGVRGADSPSPIGQVMPSAEARPVDP